ncbi:MAG: hypothetical protein ACRDMJ_17430 [Solirubrobacteraceae bacterium]
MATLLVTGRPSSCYVSCKHSGLGGLLVTRLRAWSLDSRLAHGACPDTSAALSLRAHQLIGLTERRRLAREIGAVLREASRPPRQRGWEVAVCRGQVLAARAELCELAERLLSPLPIDACGVAQTQMLLRDGAGPVYLDTGGGSLRRAVRTAIDALEPRVEADDE